MADLEFTRTETLSREETAKLLVSLADALSAGNGHARLLLGDTTVQLRVPERMQTEVEVEVDGNEVETRDRAEMVVARAGQEVNSAGLINSSAS